MTTTPADERLPAALKLKIASDAAEGVGFLHRCAILHRNLKPSNVLLVSRDLSASVNAKITDFGSRFANSTYCYCYFFSFLFCVCGNGVYCSRTMTERVALAHRIGVGRPAYMAPEILSLQPHSVQSDIYSFGMTLYVLVAHEEPYANLSSHWDIVQAITSNVRPPIAEK